MRPDVGRCQHGRVALRTAFTDLMGIDVPVALAPMGGCAGGALAAAVSNAGGLGLVGAGRGDQAWLERELSIVSGSAVSGSAVSGSAVSGSASRPWGVGFLSWSAGPEAVELALTYRPDAVMLSFGDPRPLAPTVKAAGARLMIQVTDLDEARQALDVGADVIVAQGGEAGGHGGGRATLPFVPVVVDLAAPTPVLAAGGIADGRGLAAALALGAAGALVGTRFQVSSEALAPAEVTRAILDGSGEDTERTRVVDIARGAPWPARYPGRALRNAFLDRWRGRESELEADEDAKSRYREAATRGDPAALPVWASEAIDLITHLAPAADLLAQLAEEAEAALARAAGAVT